jgi:hypothetical protein
VPLPPLPQKERKRQKGIEEVEIKESTYQFFPSFFLLPLRHPLVLSKEGSIQKRSST